MCDNRQVRAIERLGSVEKSVQLAFARRSPGFILTGHIPRHLYKTRDVLTVTDDKVAFALVLVIGYGFSS